MPLLFTWPEDALLIGLTIVVAVIAHALLNYLIKKLVSQSIAKDYAKANTVGARAAVVMAKASGVAIERHRQRVQTVGTLLRSIVTVTIYVVMVLTILAILGVQLGPLLATAGIGGIALGLGAQSLVKDYLSGLFLAMEDQYGVGDFVTLGEVSGTVEELTLRYTKVRSANGQAWYVRNGEITTVGNVTQGWSMANVDVPVAYDEDSARVIRLLNEVCEDIDQDTTYEHVLLETPTVVGVDSVTATTMTIKITAKCAPNEQWALQRDLRERAMQKLTASGVRGPAPFPAPTTTTQDAK